MKYLLVACMLVLAACGKNGSNGADGAPGVGCTVSAVGANSVAPNGGSLITCAQGTSSLILNGTNGTNGSNGSNGTNGTPGTLVTAEQFCPGTTPTYPSNFPEFGFLISGVLYGVYSTNGGFLAALPAGRYMSNAVGSQCDFTINPNGSISP